MMAHEWSDIHNVESGPYFLDGSETLRSLDFLAKDILLHFIFFEVNVIIYCCTL
jgi:hypothetical protein